ncbi:S8/S53 family peptidase [Clostridium lundense]|uniref:S8/S53 family peptidase n=1 Tax=Clostridium lundense TaxID=319475 RepID=UPI000A617D72|nr:S8/S53 family peptidase [Clostridium lundense]
MFNKTKKHRSKKKILITTLCTLTVIILVAFFLPIVTYRTSPVNGNSGIARRPEAANRDKGKLKKLPSYNKNSPEAFQVDLISSDISDLDVSDRVNDLMYSDFDSKTKWPKSLPKEFDPEAIMNYGKNPGLNIRKLHEKGITGKDVNVAIIDQMLLTGHEEYKDRLKFYEEIHANEDGGASMHGAALSSIAVGKNVGVAPEANLYYIAQFYANITPLSFLTMKYSWDFTYLAKSVDRILEINKTLPKDKKIRVISMSIGWGSGQKGFKEIDEAVKRAKNEGILVLCSNLDRYYNIKLMGLGREPLSDPDDLNSYDIGIWWKNEPESFEKIIDNTIMVPMDSRCTASPTGNSDYVFYRNGGLSWVTPYVAGLYALACQVKPDITPKLFFKEVIATGDVKTIEKDGKKHKFGTIINPERLLDKLQKEK